MNKTNRMYINSLIMSTLPIPSAALKRKYECIDSVTALPSELLGVLARTELAVDAKIARKFLALQETEFIRNANGTLENALLVQQEIQKQSEQLVVGTHCGDDKQDGSLMTMQVPKLTPLNVVRKEISFSQSRQVFYLQIAIRHSFTNQLQSRDKKLVFENPSWTLQIGGTFVDSFGNAIKASRFKFSQFVRKVTIELDASLYPGAQSVVEWVANPMQPPCDGFEIKRIGAINTMCNIFLFVNDDKIKVPEKFVLKGCAQICTMSELIIWVYEYCEVCLFYGFKFK